MNGRYITMIEMSKCKDPPFVRVYWPFRTWVLMWFRKARDAWPDRKRKCAHWGASEGASKEPWWQPPFTYYWSSRS